MFDFFRRENINSQLILVIISIAMYVLLTYAYYDVYGNENYETANQLWSWVQYSIYGIFVFAGVLVRSFIVLVKEKNF